MRTSIVLALALAAVLSGCATPEPSNLTPGMAKKTIVKGETTQAEVMEVFGPPDLVTHRDGMDIWTWDKVRQDVQVSKDFLYIIFYGAEGEKTRSSSTSTMLIVYFDEHDVVRDYRLSTTRF